MKTVFSHDMFRRLSVALIVIGFVSMAGCNTWKGAGKDVERTGEVMQGE